MIYPTAHNAFPLVPTVHAPPVPKPHVPLVNTLSQRAHSPDPDRYRGKDIEVSLEPTERK